MALGLPLGLLDDLASGDLRFGRPGLVSSSRQRVAVAALRTNQLSSTRLRVSLGPFVRAALWRGGGLP